MKIPSFSTFKLSPDDLALLLQKCMKARALRQGKQIHAVLLTSGVDMNLLSLSSKLVGMYAGCGDVGYAHQVFDKIPKPNVFALNWLVLASAFNGQFEDAIGYFYLMQELGIVGNKFTFPVVLKVCVGLMDLNKGKEVHAVVNKLGFEKDVSLANALIDMYYKCGSLCYARRMFDRMLDRDVVSWTSMICGYFNIGKTDQALLLFERMRLDGLEPNDFTWNAMIAGFARCGDTNRAYALLSRMTKEGLVPDLVTWNALISGFTQGQHADEAFKLFRMMLVSGIKANLVTITGLLPACGIIGSIQRGREIHGLIYRMGFDVNVFVASALIDMYSKCGSVKNARSVFDQNPVNNIASWNALIGCYGKMVAAYELVKGMPIEVTESIIGAFFNGCKVHGRRDLAKMMAEAILKMELKRPGGFVTLSNIHAANGEWEEVENVRMVMKQRKILKQPGFSWLGKKMALSDLQ
ncbi:hypothetical protein EV1_005710 [Malus domestica]|uniref:Pentacotripeptide-repeat region of PRORP domain-containing protein n=1 Tax=Malus domestica TaxID=3750 RepID=A0A498IPD5_MALDO|nr:hypothetical protein DVH24_041984 [Malus domestica]